MPVLETNFSEVPDKVPVMDVGQYYFAIDKVGFREAEGKRFACHTFDLIVTEGPNKGKHVFDEFPVEFLKDKNSPASVKFKRFLKSIGWDLSQAVDTDLLKGKSGVMIVDHSTYADKQGVSQTKAFVKEYIAN